MRTFSRHEWRVLFTIMAAMLVATPLHAKDFPGVKIDAVVTGTGVPREASSLQREGSMVETIYLSGDHERLDFHAGAQLRGRIYRNGDQAWLVRLPSHQVLPANGLRIGKLARLDPKQPCFDLDFSCHRVDDRLIAGRRAIGWRYRHAEQKGPQGTDHGTFWIDAQTGVMLGFKGRDLADRDYRMRVVSVHAGPLPGSTFKLSETVRRAQRAWGGRSHTSEQ